MVVSDRISDVPLAEVEPGDVVLVLPGEVVPVDGVVTDGVAIIDESALTGEALPVDRAAGAKVRSGTVNAGPSVQLRALADAEQSTYAGIIRLVAAARSSQAPIARLADKWAAAFAGITIVVDVVVALVTRDLHRAVAVLVVATPCPLLLAVPIAFISGMSRAAARGVVVKGAGSLEALASADTVLLDKTGTITSGHATLREIAAPGCIATEMLALAASAEQHSHHVLAASIVDSAIRSGIQTPRAASAAEEPGQGVSATINEQEIRIGRLDWITPAPPSWMERLGHKCELDGSTLVAMARNGEPVAAFVLDDSVRPEAARTMRQLRAAGVGRIVMVTGDRAAIATPMATALGMDGVLADCTPSGKVDAVHAERHESSRGLVMVGDGINDAAALAAADIGIALGARGSSSSSEAADVVITVDRLDRLVTALRVAKRTRRIALQSAGVGMGLSGLAMAFAALGFLAPAPGAFLQEVIDVIAIASALRALRSRGSSSSNAEAVAITSRFRGEHEAISHDIDRIRTTADALETPLTDTAVADAHELQHILVDRILPHERAEERYLYPVMARIVGGDDPTGPMSRGHAEIERLIRLSGLSIDELGSRPLTADDVTELRRLLYGLYAILRLHTAQEDEAYLSLTDSAPPSAARAV
jgi:heavy metal translocating P-type ATPase